MLLLTTNYVNTSAIQKVPFSDDTVTFSISTVMSSLQKNRSDN